MVNFTYKGGCGIRERKGTVAFNERIDLGYKWMKGFKMLVSNTMLFKTVSYTTKNLRKICSYFKLNYIICIVM